MSTPITRFLSLVCVLRPPPPTFLPTFLPTFRQGDSADSLQSALATPTGDFLDSILEARAEYDSLPVKDAGNEPDGTVDR